MGRKGRPNREVGGTYIDTDGYVRVKMPKHPHANNRGYVMQHRVVMERKIGRRLKRKERVHHINEIRNDNHPKNLHLCKNNREHSLIHRPPKFCYCGKPHFGKGFCAKHYTEWYREHVWNTAATCEQCGKAMRPSSYTCKDNRKLCRDCRWPKLTCTRDGCGKKVQAKGLCHAHYSERFVIPCSKCGKLIRKSGRNRFPALCWRCTFPVRVCQICGLPNDAADLCMNHYARWRRAKREGVSFPAFIKSQKV